MRLPRITLRRGLLLTLGLAALVVAAPLLLVAIGVTVDAGPWRGRVAEMLQNALHRPVHFDGRAELTFSLRPSLRVGGIRVLNPPGFGAQEFATLGSAELSLDLLPLLRYDLRVLEVNASDVKVRLETAADGRTNWDFGADVPTMPALSTDATAPTGKAAAPARPAAASPPPSAPARFSASKVDDVAVDHFTLERVAVEIVAAGARTHTFNLDRMVGEAADGQPLRAAMLGTVEQRFPYTVEIAAGTLSDLVASRGTWPLHLALSFAGTTATLDGALDRPLQGAGGALAFGLRTGDLAEVERLLQIDLPPVGATRLDGSVRWSPGQVELADLQGAVGQTTLEGHVALDTRGARPRVTGELVLPTLDLRPFLGQPAPPDQPPRSLLDAYRELERLSFDLRQLGLFDADVALSVGQWLSLPGDVRAAAVALRLEGGVLRAPLSAVIAQVPLRGELLVDGAAATPRFRLQLDASDTPLGGLAQLIAHVDGVAGHLDHFAFRINAQGATLGALTRSMDVRVGVDGARLTYGNGPGGRPVALRLDRFEALLPRQGRLTGSARGALLDEPFEATLQAGDLPALAAGQRWPLALHAQASGARLAVTGTLPAAAGDDGVDLQVQLDAPRAGSVARWLGLSPGAQAAVKLAAHVHTTKSAVRVQGLRLDLGRSTLTGDLTHSGLGTARTFTTVRLDVPLLDEVELRTLLPQPAAAPATTAKPAEAPAKPVPAAAPRNAGGTLDIPILPSRIDLSDADLDLRLHQVRLGLTDLTDLRFKGAIRDGHMAPAPFGATLAGTRFEGSAAVDLRGDTPEAALQLTAARVDVGQLLQRLKVAEGIDARVDAMHVALTGRGRRLGDLLEGSDVQVDLQGGQLTLHDPQQRPWIVVALRSGALAAASGAPVTLTLDGAIDRTPVAIRMSSGRMADFARASGELPFVLSAEAEGIRMDLNGRVGLPITRGEGFLALTMQGRRLDALEGLSRTRLPPWGPWSIGGRFVAAGGGYEMPNLEVKVGESTLVGRGALALTGARPRLEVTLRAPNIQLDDFRVRGADEDAAAKDAPARTRDPAALRQQARDAARHWQRLLSRELLLRLDAQVDVEVTQVVSGADRLGNGTLQARLQDGRLQLAPVSVEMPGGSARITLTYEPLAGGDDVQVQARVRINRFDYAVLARRLKPDTDMSGRFTFRMDLDSTAPVEALMEKGNGRLDIGLWPISLSADTFDMWAVNLFVALLPAVDKSRASRVNCARASFELAGGKLTHKTLLIDTSQMRVGGEARVDFADESVFVHLQPKPKTPQFFSLATPVEVNGHITDYRVGVGAGSVITTIGRFITSIVTAPFEKLLSKEVPRDGADVCGVRADVPQ